MAASALAISIPVTTSAQTTFEVRIVNKNHDADEDATGDVERHGNTIQLGSLAWNGFRFTSVTIPQGATITGAYVEFTSEADTSELTDLSIFGQDIDDASSFSNASNNISNRTRTSASVTWTNLPAWSTGQKYQTHDLKTIIQEIVDRSGWISGNNLVIITRSDDSNGNRSAWAHDGDSSKAALLHVEYSNVDPPIAPDLLFVVDDASSLTSQETARQTLLESWGYNVTLISASDSQANFDSLVSSNDVAYISEEVDELDLGTKLKIAPIGVVNEQATLTDEFSVSTDRAFSTDDTLDVQTTSHYITSEFALGNLTIFDSSQPATSVAGNLAEELLVLGQWGSSKSLIAIEGGGKLQDGGVAAGRRVQLPWGGSSFDINSLNTDGETLLKRSIEWAAGLTGHWKLDETTGTVAVDSSVNANDGSLAGGFDFDTNSASPAKVDNGLEFDGTNDRITIPNDSSLQLSEALTISAWVKGDAWGSGSDVDVILRKGESEPTNYQLGVAAGRVTLFLDESDSAGVPGDTVLQTGVWYHVAATWDGTTARIYVNGQLDNDPPPSRAAPIGTDTNTLYLGGTPSGDYFDGTIDDVRLFNHALGADEIVHLSGLGQPKGVRIIKWIEIK